MRDPLQPSAFPTACAAAGQCPTCHAPALPSGDPIVFASTSGPVIHQMWRCAAGCWWFSYVVPPELPAPSDSFPSLH